MDVENNLELKATDKVVSGLSELFECIDNVVVKHEPLMNERKLGT